MRALTIWQPWASLIVAGAKPIEWRSHSRCASLAGARIVIHAGMRKPQPIELMQLRLDCLREAKQIADGLPAERPTGLDIAIALDLLCRAYADPRILPIGAGLGTAIVGLPRLASDLGFPVDSDRLEHQNWGWPLSDIERWAEPVPIRGGRGFWNWPANEFAGAAA